jgi:hypothetical protein
MEVEKMNERGGTYCAAMNAAMDELNLIRQVSDRLRNRLYQLDTVVEALKPLIVLGEQTVVEDRRPEPESIETAAEPVRADRLTPQMVGIAIPQVEPQKMNDSADPIQRRINSVLGLAVA